ncbi:alpha-glucan phosphorylase [Pseudoclavibacter sp. RFBG4]|uniref:alpha-glucan family phosphorylase n=1 Tax=Pseudoclavibacter sp. RFBG4 TaxID=2080575 RepID=UPI000CE891B1|nr:alpha-glucan family phosphorylase [Pseudoclavibacter sp. RFBG4]PPG35171.1 alpha-glucan phosphorylase [Pseudoclavibacter sp. RFBG4]
MKAYDSLSVSTVLPPELAPLRTLAKNLRWSWRSSAERLFAGIDEQLWRACGRNPIVMLRSLPASRVAELAADPEFVARLGHEAEDLSAYLDSDRWFHKHTRGTADEATSVAYFSMEFGITESLPVYSGGLGVLAGDHLKSASDLGAPIIGVGLLYTYGYFSQTLSREGWQQEAYSEHPPKDLAVDPVLDASGAQSRVSLAFPDGRTLEIALWEAQVGGVPLLLLDTNLPDNPEDLRAITDRLYGGDSEHRIRQELVLGVGGVRAVQTYAELTGRRQPTVFHLNEGHAGFSGVERIGQLMTGGEAFETALAAVRSSTVFTTHTPVPAGIDRFDAHLVQRYLGSSGGLTLVPDVPLARIMELGAEDDPGRFNMAHLGLRLAQYANGVAKLHGVVSRGMFAKLYPGVDAEEVPIGSITNGVHIPSWTRPSMLRVIEAMNGGHDLATSGTWNHPDAVGAEELWRIRGELRAELVRRARESVRASWKARGAQDAELGWIRDVLDPERLTIGFARRVSTYKRLTLMLQDRDRLARILNNPDRPVQFVIAGKAHPADMGGKQLLQELVNFADEAGVRDRIVFLPDYNVTIAKHLVAGSDVWLNNPVRPQEASGTSGMKAVMNGCLTFSISDGWWDEMADDAVGWTIPDTSGVDERTRDALEAGALYDILEHEIAPLFYARDERGLPIEWVEKVRRSVSVVGPKVAAERMVRDYVTDLYLPAGRSARVASDLVATRSFATWLGDVRAAWPSVRVESVVAENHEPNAGESVRLSARVELGRLNTDDVLVEAVVGTPDAEGELLSTRIVEMRPAHEGESTFVVDVPIDEPGRLGYTVRVQPRHAFLQASAELGLVRLPA